MEKKLAHTHTQTQQPHHDLSLHGDAKEDDKVEHEDRPEHGNIEHREERAYERYQYRTSHGDPGVGREGGRGDETPNLTSDISHLEEDYTECIHRDNTRSTHKSTFESD